LKKEEAIKRINQLSKENTPFLFVIDFLMKKIIVIPLSDVSDSGIFYDIQGITNFNYTNFSFNKELTFVKKPISKIEYQKGFELVQEGLMKGNSFLCNLTFPTPIEINLTLKEIFNQSKAKYKLLFKNEFVCFSPEIFVKINEKGIISSHPMKGTIDAQHPDAEQIILENLKEKAEHNTIVDLIRNDLSQVAKKVNVTRFRYIDRLKTNGKELLQVSSEIQGQLPENWKEKLGDILFRLLPAGSISGAPKPSTLQIIENAELGKRGYYTGIFGIFDGKTLDSGVMIRFIEQNEQGQKTFRSGGGITVFSELNAEYQEFIDKIYVPIFNHKSN
jgi:para-aminobenzoate synthetase component 1